MFSPIKIKEAAVGLVGIRQPYNADYDIFDAESLSSSSGLYINDVSFFKPEYFVDVVSDKDATDADVNTEFKEIIKTSAVDVCSRVFNKMDVVDRDYIYTKATVLNDTESGIPNGFVGWKFEFDSIKDRSFKIGDVFLSFEGTGSVELMLFSSWQKIPLETRTVALDGTKLVYKESLEWVLDNTDFYKGEFFIGYIYDGTLVPYTRDYEDANYQSEFKGLCIEKAIVPDHATNELFRLDKVETMSQDTGLNMNISVYDDRTDFILNNLSLFARPILLKMAIIILEKFVSSTRSNMNERYSNEIIVQVMAAVNGLKGDSGINERGLKSQLATEITQLQKEIEKIRNSQNGGRQIIVTTLS